MRQVKDNGHICHINGDLNEYSIGWNTVPFKDCKINKNHFKKKIWNNYTWMNKDFVLNFAIIDMGYASLVQVDFYDLNSCQNINRIYRYPLSKYIILDERINSYAHFKGRKKFINVLRSSNHLNIDLKWKEIDITSIIYLDYESLNMVIPLGYDYFHYTSKHMNLKTEGILTIGKVKYDLRDCKCFIDYGRGVWKRQTNWNWITSGFIDENNINISINLASKYTDNIGINENCIKIDDKIYKLKDDIKFYNINNEGLINIKSLKSDEVNLEFKPSINYTKANNMLFLKSKFNQIVGILNGYIKYRDKYIQINNAIGWCENHFAKC
ncbi:DUF2804 domain-containing protein [Paraclostridium bifermentans]|uniref:DUF2804 domain-containing protein n=1 Tax=Paraclostridium bifermentans TaxID=1490 RepID=UPI00359C6106